MAGLSGPDRLDAALRFIVEFQSTYSLGSLADIEPEHVLHQMKRVLPIMHERIARIIPGDDSDIAAAAVVRIAVCHYMIARRKPEPVPGRVAPRRGPRHRLGGACRGRSPASRRASRDLRRDQLGMLQVQEMPCALDDFERRPRSR